MGYLFLLLRLNSYIFYHSIAEILVSNNVRGAVYNLWSKYGRIETVGVRNNVENNHEAVNRGDHPLHERLTTPRTLMQVHDMFHSYSWTRYHTRAYAFRFCNFGHDCDERQWTSNNRSYIAYFLFVTCSWFLIHDSETFDLKKGGIKKKKKKKKGRSNIRRVRKQYLNNSTRHSPEIVSVNCNVRSKCQCSCILQFTRNYNARLVAFFIDPGTKRSE